jgi:hypothetical protein
MIPVEVTAAPWHYTTWPDALDHWQTVIAGVLALAAGVLTVVATMIITRKQIAVAQKQIDTTLRLEQERVGSEARAFRATLDAAMVRVLAEADCGKKSNPQAFAQGGVASVEALAVRQCMTKGAFAELRAACVRLGSPLTGEFLDLEREIDSFAGQLVDVYSENRKSRQGKIAGLGDQLTVIEAKATKLRQKAAEQ